jgi:hypothetical protein
MHIGRLVLLQVQAYGIITIFATNSEIGAGCGTLGIRLEGSSVSVNLCKCQLCIADGFYGSSLLCLRQGRLCCRFMSPRGVSAFPLDNAVYNIDTRQIADVFFTFYSIMPY